MALMGQVGLRNRLRRRLESASAAPQILLLTLFVTLPTLTLGFQLDDHVLRAVLKGTWPGPEVPFWDLYRFVSGDAQLNRAAMAAGVMPWWSAPDLRLYLVRPLSSLLFWADYRVFGDAALGYHVHTLAWYVALVAAVGQLFRALFSRATAHLSLLIFACSTAHFWPYAWVSARHMLVAALPCVLGLWALVARVRGGPLWCALGISVGLLGGEAALSTFGFLIGYVALDRSRAIRARLRDVLPSFVVGVSYLAIYATVGGGAAHSGGYVDPFHAPLEFMSRSAKMLPILLGNAVLGVPADLAQVGAQWPLVVVGAFATLCTWFALRKLTSSLAGEGAQLWWLVLGAIIALLPTLGGFSGARVLLLPNLGFAPLLALLIRRGTAWRGFARGFGYLLLVVHVLLPPLLIWGHTANTFSMARAVERIAREAEIGAGRPRVFIVGVSDPMVTMYAGAALTAEMPERLACWSVLSGSKQAHRLERTGERELLLIAEEAPMLRGAFETLYRAPSDVFRAFDTASSCGATFRVVAVEHGLPRRVSVHFDRPLEDPSIRILAWKDGRLTALTPPPLATGVHIAWSAGPLGLF
jgi:hypothetical protein